jgi:alkylation response protein AidB-like acyl-CoA dehydrogenase
MDLSLTEIQNMLRTSARDFLKTACPGKFVRQMAEEEKGYTQELWQQMGENGWMGLMLPEKYGGAGCGFSDLVILLEEMGRVCLPGPFFSSAVLGGLSLLEAGSEEQKAELLPQLAAGKLLFTLAVSETGTDITPAGIQTQATQEGNGFVLKGKKLFIPDAHVCDYFICAARTQNDGKPAEGITLFLVDAHTPGVKIELLKTLAGDKQCEIVLDGVKVPATNILGTLHQGWPVLQRILDKATIARCAEMAGGARQMLDITLNYAKERKAFGHPIGAYQAIQHNFADMVIKADGFALMTYNAAWMVDQNLPLSRETAMTKALANEFFRETSARCVQIHGAIGFTEEHDAPLYYKRAKAWEISLGSTSYQLGKLAV